MGKFFIFIFHIYFQSEFIRFVLCLVDFKFDFFPNISHFSFKSNFLNLLYPGGITAAEYWRTDWLSDVCSQGWLPKKYFFFWNWYISSISKLFFCWYPIVVEVPLQKSFVFVQTVLFKCWLIFNCSERRHKHPPFRPGWWGEWGYIISTNLWMN